MDSRLQPSRCRWSGGCSTNWVNEGSDGNIPAKTEIVVGIGALATFRFAYEHEN